MSFYYDKINLYFRLKQQRSHYQRIVQAKKNINFQKIQHQVPKKAKPYRSQLQKEREIKQDNQKLYHRLQQIRNHDGLLQSVQKQSCKRGLKDNRKFTYENQTLSQKINQQNVRFIERLTEVKPKVGTRQNWQKSFKKNRSIEKNLQKFVKNESIDPDEFIRDTLTALARKRTNRKVYTSLTHNQQTQTQISSSVVLKKSRLQNRQQQREGEQGQKSKRRQKRKGYRKSMNKIQMRQHRQHSKSNINEIIMGMNAGETQETSNQINQYQGLRAKNKS